MDAIRTPDEVLADLPDFPFAPHYREVDGLRLAHIDEGDGAPVVMWHGEPTWSFLWRKVLPPVRDAGYRVICPDYVGFGRSDKPTDRGWYSYDRHVAMAATLLEDLDLRDVTFVMHDWGGPIGLRLAMEHSDRVSRLVMMNTGISDGTRPMGEEWERMRAFVDRIEDVPMSPMIQGGTSTELPPEVLAGYEKPFPNAASKAGMRAFPGLIPQTPDAPGADHGRRVLEALPADERPKLLIWGADDFILPPHVAEMFGALLGVEPHMLDGAHHFLQEDRGADIGALIADWLTSQSG